MFDLNQAIKQWRQAMNAQPGIDLADLDELEDHLREEVSELQAKGLQEEEAFLVGSRRLGKPEDLSSEFAIADPASRRNFRLRWMVLGALALMFLWLATEVLTNFGTGTMHMMFGGHPMAGVLGAGLTSGLMRILLLLAGVVLIWKLLATDGSSRRLRTMGGGSIILVAFLLAFLALVSRTGSRVFMAHATTHDNFILYSTAQAWVNLLVMFLLPALLLLGLWRLVRNQ